MGDNAQVTNTDVIFSFNKKHLEDPSIPMWVLKMKGQSYYTHHVDCRKGWSTKETPDNTHTKGAIKIKNCDVEFSENISTITDHVPPQPYYCSEQFTNQSNNRKGIQK